MKDYSTKQISKKLQEEVMKALQNIRGWGSVNNSAVKKTTISAVKSGA